MNEKKVFTGTKALTMSAIMAGLVLIMVIISTYLIDLGILTLLILPLFSTLIVLTCERKYVLVYFVATLLMSFINFQIALFEILPSLITGLLVGLLIKIKIHGNLIIFLNSIVLTTIQIFSTLLIQLIYKVDMIEVFSKLLKINIDTMILIYPLFLFIISLIQASISYLISTNELKKLGYVSNEKKDSFELIFAVTFLMVIFTLICDFYVKSLSFLFMGASIYFALTLSSYVYSYKYRRLTLIVQTALFIIALILIYVLFTIVDLENISSLLLLIPFSSLISASMILIIEKIFKKNQIEESSFEKLS